MHRLGQVVLSADKALSANKLTIEPTRRVLISLSGSHLVFHSRLFSFVQQPIGQKFISSQTPQNRQHNRIKRVCKIKRF